MLYLRHATRHCYRCPKNILAKHRRTVSQPDRQTESLLRRSNSFGFMIISLFSSLAQVLCRKREGERKSERKREMSSISFFSWRQTYSLCLYNIYLVAVSKCLVYCWLLAWARAKERAWARDISLSRLIALLWCDNRCHLYCAHNNLTLHDFDRLPELGVAYAMDTAESS